MKKALAVLATFALVSNFGLAGFAEPCPCDKTNKPCPAVKTECPKKETCKKAIKEKKEKKEKIKKIKEAKEAK